jgi:hypothetical protein
MDSRDKIAYERLRADPVKYAAYLERKGRERRARQIDKGSETARKRRWRANNPDKAQALRNANHRVDMAIRKGTLKRPCECSKCGATGDIEAHHHLGYAPEHWLDVIWMCIKCHAKEHFAT